MHHLLPPDLQHHLSNPSLWCILTQILNPSKEALIVPNKPFETSDIYRRSQRSTETPKPFSRALQTLACGYKSCPWPKDSRNRQVLCLFRCNLSSESLRTALLKAPAETLDYDLLLKVEEHVELPTPTAAPSSFIPQQAPYSPRLSSSGRSPRIRVYDASKFVPLKIYSLVSFCVLLMGYRLMIDTGACVSILKSHGMAGYTKKAQRSGDQ